MENHFSIDSKVCSIEGYIRSPTCWWAKGAHQSTHPVQALSKIFDPMPSYHIKYLLFLFISTACIMSWMALVPIAIEVQVQIWTRKIFPFTFKVLQIWRSFDTVATLHEVHRWEFYKILQFPWSFSVFSACSWIQIKWEKLREQTSVYMMGAPMCSSTGSCAQPDLEIGLAVSSDLHGVVALKNIFNKLYIDKVCSPCRSFPNCFCSNMLLSDFNWP